MARNLTPQERDRIFGPLKVIGQSGRDSVRFESPPPLVTVPFGKLSTRVHELAAESLRAVARDLEDAGLIDGIKSISGFSARLVRNADGSNSPNLSAHAYGAAVDVNHDANPQGTLGTDEQAQLAPFFERHGWFWGRNFTEPDPHHFAFQGVDPLAVEGEPPNVPTPDDEVFPEPTRPPEAKAHSTSSGMLLALAGLGVGLFLTAKKRH